MRLCTSLRSRLILVIAVFVTAMVVFQAWNEYRGKLALLLAQARKTVAVQYYPVKRLVQEQAAPDGVHVTSEMLAPLKKEFGFNISVVVPDGAKFRYAAKTHDLSIPEKMFPWLKKVMAAEGPLFRRVSKNGKELVTYYTQMRDASGRVAGVVAIPRDITSDLAELRRDAWLRLGVGLGLLAAVLGIIFLVLHRCVNSPLTDVLGFLDAAADDGYSGRLRESYPAEMGALARGVNGLMATVQEAMGSAMEEREKALEQAGSAERALVSVRENQGRVNRMVEKMVDAANRAGGISEDIRESSRQLADQVRDTADNAGSQRERAQETAKAMEEMNEAVLSVAENASRAAEGAQIARDKALQGADVVEQVNRATAEARERADRMKGAMDELGRRAEGIGRIINVITDIADQTNLLALNAAIEAARAGDAGRGFAVVADEVRKLAEKTMQATKEVEEAVSGIQAVSAESMAGMDSAAQAVSRSSSLSVEAGGYLRAIVDIVTQTADNVQTIAAAAEEQSATSEHITDSMEGINEIAAQTVEGMGRSHGTIKHVSALAGDLQGLITELRDCAEEKEDAECGLDG
ncbi:methyl-accepting chemotaxis protein [Desulfocurvus sp. DL9XJH121]